MSSFHYATLAPNLDNGYSVRLHDLITYVPDRLERVESLCNRVLILVLKFSTDSEENLCIQLIIRIINKAPLKVREQKLSNLFTGGSIGYMMGA